MADAQTAHIVAVTFAFTIQIVSSTAARMDFAHLAPFAVAPLLTS